MSSTLEFFKVNRTLGDLTRRTKYGIIVLMNIDYHANVFFEHLQRLLRYEINILMVIETAKDDDYGTQAQIAIHRAKRDLLEDIIHDFDKLVKYQ